MMDRPTLDELSLLHDNICQALGDPKRLLILYALHEQPQHGSALAATLDIPQPTVARHLQVLRERSLVIPERDGATVVYRLAEPQIIEVLDLMRQILRHTVARQSDRLNGREPEPL